MKTTLLAAASVLAMTAVAGAADLPQSTPAYAPVVPQASATNWEGAYIGAHLGAAWLRGDMTAYTPNNSYNGFGVSGLDTSGATGGLHIGYNHMLDNNVVLGLEAGASLANLSKHSSDNVAGTEFWRKLNWTGTLTGTLGYAMDSTMLYGKAGLAVGGFEVGHDQGGTNISSKSTQYGYVLGAGVEYAFDPNWSVNVEYDYMNFGKDSIHVSGPSADIFLKQGGDVHQVMAGVNYRF